MPNRSKKLAFIILGLLVVANLVAWIGVQQVRQSRLLEVAFLDVGQGDAIFVETPHGHQILIDGGPDTSVLERLGVRMPFFDRSLDMIVLTHPDRDHMAGLLEVLERYTVEHIVWTGVVRDTAEWQSWATRIEQEGAQIHVVHAGTTIQFQEQPSLHLTVLWPDKDLAGQTTKNVNDTSIVAKLVYETTAVLLTGDITKAAEQDLVRSQNVLAADILKVSHHGSKTSSSSNFVEIVAPGLAVIQVGGDNRYGHPHPDVLAKYEEFGIEVMRTDEDGDILVRSDGRIINY